MQNIEDGKVAQQIPNWCLYVWVNPLASMNAGKAEAHSGHAASQFASKVFWETNCPIEARDYKNWARITGGSVPSYKGFGTQINLGLGSQKWAELKDTLSNFSRHPDVKCLYGVVEDPTYPLIVPSDAIPLMDKSLINVVDEQRGIITTACETAVWMFIDKDDPLWVELNGIMNWPLK